MGDISRRSVLKILGGICFVTSLEVESNSFSNSSQIDEFYAALLVWKEHEKIEPERYLDLYSNRLGKTSIQYIISEEFRNLRVMNVNGLILSKIEVAFLASIAKEKLKV